MRTSETLAKKDFAIGSLIAIVMAIVFVAIGGRPLLATFVPGLIITWSVFAILFMKQSPIPDGRTLYPIYFGVFAWQFVHFFEEFSTGFYQQFPTLYGASPYSTMLFVGINMFSYFVFALAFIGAFAGNRKFLLIPVLFFVIYGAMGNAISHVWWVIWERAYFPGFFTALAYWLLGPWLLSKFVGSWKRAFIVMACFAVILIPSITLFMS
ncbi:hypothetical protein [Martelella sp. HB161492]|uniref:hypothetical protein n=1 Tax=Martelella sp. HB161492 TaxID=2720726 RepID=UPI0015912B34|nr:hypothetical protein [Martelella sp. HB161492]